MVARRPSELHMWRMLSSRVSTTPAVSGLIVVVPRLASFRSFKYVCRSVLLVSEPVAMLTRRDVKLRLDFRTPRYRLERPTAVVLSSPCGFLISIDDDPPLGH